MMPNQQPQATPAPIHDITDPVWFLPYPVWMIVAAAIGLIALVVLTVWLVKRRRPVRPLTSREKAFVALAELRGEGASADPYAFGVKVSDVLRTYIRDQHGLDAVTRTSVEFLEVLRNNPVFTEAEKSSLSVFLERADLLKYARLSADGEDFNALLETAEHVVRGEHADQPAET